MIVCGCFSEPATIEFVAAKLKTLREGCYGSCLRTSNIAQTQTEAESEGE
jgi:hypothetical protein